MIFNINDYKKNCGRCYQSTYGLWIRQDASEGSLVTELCGDCVKDILKEIENNVVNGWKTATTATCACGQKYHKEDGDSYYCHWCNSFMINWGNRIRKSYSGWCAINNISRGNPPAKLLPMVIDRKIKNTH